MLTTRASGVLLHPTCLSTRYGIGDLGPSAEAWLDWLSGAGQSYWQVLPLGPTDMGGSPYQSPSAFGGNPWLISPQRLRDDGLITSDELLAAEIPNGETAASVHFEIVIPRKKALLETATKRFKEREGIPELRREFEEFRQAQAGWLDNHAFFMALREANGERSWLDWTTLVTEGSHPSPKAHETLADRIETHAFWQFLFFRQWDRLRQYARERSIHIIGDAPIYVAHDSCDVWAEREWFQLDETGRSTAVAGVPPDYFCAEGQLWSNPLYDWDALHRDGYRWWIRRLQAVLRQVDLLRLDHFRAFEAYWSVPATDTTAVNGTWIPGPRDEFLSAIREALAADGNVPIIAEDLGMITDEVHALRHRFLLPGMKVLQFRLPGDPWEPPFRLDEFEPNSVVYTGTHDNDTTISWFLSEIASKPERLAELRKYTPAEAEHIAWEFIEIAWKSSSLLAIAPLQDILQLGGDARMNAPGTVGIHNWRWKLQPGMLTQAYQQRLHEITERTGRRG
ncbi:4-alpha-glucanotransferase [bacterium]|nr:4-alpha-glucanotransferase [bacterium]